MNSTPEDSLAEPGSLGVLTRPANGRTGRLGTGAAVALLSVLFAASLHSTSVLAAAGGLLQPARVSADGSVIWVENAPVVPADLAGRIRSARTNRDSVLAWAALTDDPYLRPSALGRLATWAQQRGEFAEADAMWAELARTPGPWQWEALRGRTDLLTGRPAAADSLLASASPSGWTPLEVSAWLYRRARLRLAMQDTAGAETLARRVVQNHPETPVALRAIADLEAWRAARGTLSPVGDELAAAEAEALAGDKRAAIQRLSAVEPRLDDAARWSATLRRAALLRELRNFDSALAAASEAEHGVTEDHRRAAISLERARIHRDAGATDRALRAYERAASLAADPLLADTADAEAIRVAETSGLGPEVLRAAARLAERGGDGAGTAAARVGIEHLRNGDVDRARDWFARSGVEGGVFWISVLDSSSGRADSLLRLLASRPGFDFYRVAARESLQTLDWPRVIATAAERPHPTIRHAARLVAVGATDEALRTLERWRLDVGSAAPSAGIGHSPYESPGTPDLLQVPSWSAQPVDGGEPRWRHLLAAASVSFGAGAWGAGIRYARLAYDEIPPGDALARWSVVPWMYPPAHADLFAPHGAWTDSTALLYAVTWQESRFDTLARSTSNALGLMQLKLATAREQARLMRLPLPHEQDLFRPGRNVRLGSGYLDRIAGYFDGRRTMAIAAYNAGPTGARPWAQLPDPGGEALACELITYGQTHHYVRVVLGAWQAARSLRPRFE